LSWPVAGLFWSYFGLTGTVSGLVWADLGSGIGSLDAFVGSDRPRGCDHGGTTLVLAVELLAILRRVALVANLVGHGWSSGSAHGGDLCWAWPHRETAAAAVKGDAVVVNYDSAVVDMRDAANVYAVDGPIVVEVVAIPVAAVITEAGVAVAVVNASVEADVQAPEAAMEEIAAVIEAPVSGSPEGSVVGWSAPDTGDPVVTGGGPAPIAGSPEVVGLGGLGLFVFGEGRWWLIGLFEGLLAGVGSRIWGVVVVVLIGLSSLGGGDGLIWRRGCLGDVLLGALLGLGLGADAKDAGWSRGLAAIG
jgi:hypothetical protein